MKTLRAILFLLSMGMMGEGIAQDLFIEVVINPNLTPYLHEWETTSANDILIIVDNPTTNEFPTVFQATLINQEGEIVGQSNPTQAPVYFINPGIFESPLADLIDFESSDLNEEYEQIAVQTGQLPEGGYDLCVQALDAELFNPLGPQSCGNFFVQGYQDPVPAFPPDGQVVNSEEVEMMIFQWLPVTPIPEFGERYRFSIYEVLEDQVAQEAVLINEPIYTEEVFSQNQVFWPPEILVPQSDQSYVWTVTPFNPMGESYTIPNGVSEPWSFTIESPPTPVDPPITEETTSGGDVTTPGDHYPGTGTETDCVCGGCSVEGLMVSMNGNSAISSGNIYLNQSIQFVPQVNVWCIPEDCPASYDVNYSITYSYNNAVTVDYGVPQNQVFSFDSPGTVNVNVRVTNIHCGENPCELPECIGNYNFNVIAAPGESGDTVTRPGGGITEAPPGGGGGDETRPPGAPQDSTGRPVPPIPVPEEPVDSFPPEDGPPDSLIIKECSDISYLLNPATSIDLGMLVDNPSLSPYPRAVPIRAEGVDFDLASFFCDGCEGDNSQHDEVVRDRMNKGLYEWTLKSDLGSLMSPFKADSIEAVEDSIESVAKRKAEILSRLDEIAEELASGLEEDSLKWASKLEEAKNQKQTQDSIYQAALTLKTELETRKQELETTLESLLADIREREDSIQNRIELADTLQGLLIDRPWDEEIQAMNEIAEAEENLKTIEQQLKEQDSLIVLTSSQLAEEVALKDSLLLLSMEEFDGVKNELESTTLAISAAEAQLYANPFIRSYLIRRREWKRRSSNLLNYSSGNDNLINLKQEILSSSQQLLNTGPQNRPPLYNPIHLNLMSFNSSINGVCSSLSNEAYDICTQLIFDTQEATMRLDTALFELSNSSAILPPGIMQELSENREAIPQFETALENARNDVDQKSADYEAAMENYISTVAQMQEDRAQLKEEVADAAEYLRDLEIALNNATRNRKAHQDSIRPMTLQGIAECENKVVNFNKEREILVDSVQVSNNIMASVSDSLNQATMDEAAQEVALERLENLVQNLTELVEAIPDRREALKDEKENLEKELEDLEKAGEELEETLAQLNQPSKNASGPLVYYNPPPLEEIMKKMGTYSIFEEKVAKRDSAILERDGALQFKKEVQHLLARETDKLANSIMKYNEASGLKESLEDEKVQLQSDLAEAQQEGGLEQTDPMDEAQDNLARADSTLEYHREMVEQYLEDSTQTAQEIESAKQTLEGLKNQWAQVQQNIKDLYAQLKYQDQLLSNSLNTLRERTDQMDALMIELEELKVEKGRALSRVTAAEARQDEDAANSARDDVGSFTQQIQNKETQIDSKKAQVESASGSVNSNQLAYNNALEAVEEAEEPFKDLKRQMREAQDELDALNRKMVTIVRELTYHRSKVHEAELDKTKAERNRKEINEAINDSINQTTPIQDLQAQIDEIESSISNADSKMNKAFGKIGDTFSERDRLLELARDSLERANDKLKKAREDLQEWIIEQFETVTFEAEIELKGDDEVVDQWRSDDPEQKLTRKLQYSSSRVPTFQNKAANSFLAGNTFLSVCNPSIGFKVIPDPPQDGKPFISHQEPRNIALVFEEGRLLWEQWPVIPEEKPKPLARDLLFVQSPNGLDQDMMEYICEGPPDCQINPPKLNSIADVGSRSWDVDGQFISLNQNLTYGIWEPKEVDKPKLEEQQKLEHSYTAADYAADKEVIYKAKPNIKPGVLIEVPDTIFGVPDTTIEAIGRVVRGDHKGLSGEEVEFSVELIAGESENYGFGGDSLKVINTDGIGYAKTDFDFGDGYAEFLIHVKWKRGGTIVEEDEFVAISPLSVQFVRISNGQQEELWTKAADLLVAGGSLSKSELKGIVSNLPDCGSEDDEGVGNCAKVIRGVAGLYDHHHDFVNGELIRFETGMNGVGLSPPQDSTKWFGFTRTVVDSVGQDVTLDLTAKIEEKYIAVGRPGTDSKEYNTSQLERFKIGVEDEYFVIQLDEPVSRGESIDGIGCKIVPGEDGFVDGILLPLLDVSLTAREVELDEDDGDEPLAKAGFVVWSEKGGIEKEIRNFSFTLDSLLIRAAMGAGISGKVGHSSLPEPVSFSAELSSSGDFIGTLANLPEIEAFEFKLHQGAAVTIDMHSDVGGEEIESNFKGIIIHTASLELPPAFAKRDATKGSAIHVEEFYIGSAGIGGSVALSGDIVDIAFGGFRLQADSIAITFTDQELQAFGINGALSLPSPFEGTMECGVGYEGESFVAAVATTNPIYIPRLKAAFSLLEGTQVSYNSEEELGQFVLNAFITTEKVGKFKIIGFEGNSRGEISVDEIGINQDISFGSGFNLHVNTISFADTLDGYMMALDGGFGLPLIGLDKMTGRVAVIPGPDILVRLDSAQISFESSAVKFKGGFAFNGNEFRGDFSVSLKKILENGIEGLFIVGSKPIPANPEEYFSYWYVELSVGTKIPLGQTGLSLLKLGGGVGYHYIPPIGDSEGAPSYDSDFALKAIIGIGNTPGGEIFEGEMQMVLTGQQFSLYGKAWLLQKEESMFGEGQLNLTWAGEGQLDGFIRMFVGLPNKDGSLLSFDGKINFLFAGTDNWYVRSERIEGRAFSFIEARATIDIDTEKTYLDGRLGYGLDKTFGFGIIDVIVVFSVEAGAEFEYVYSPMSLYVKADFHGFADIDVDTPMGRADLVSASMEVELTCSANSQQIAVSGVVDVSYSVWFYSDSHNLPVGYTASL